jgi:MFS family permease
VVISRSRKYSFVVIDGLGVVGGALIFVSIWCGKLDTYCLLAGRVLQGLAAGMSMVACRVYIREYSPEALLKAMSYIPVFFCKEITKLGFLVNLWPSGIVWLDLSGTVNCIN